MPPNVQTLQADVADAVLLQGGFGIIVRGARRSGTNGTSHTSNSKSTSGTPARILPDFDDRAMEHRRWRHGHARSRRLQLHIGSELTLVVVGRLLPAACY